VTSFTVVYDACVLYPASIRDLMVEIARTGLLRAKWSHRIHLEWINALIRERPDLERARLERVAQLMNDAVMDCLVTGFESLEAGLLRSRIPTIGMCSQRRFIAMLRKS
jgi:hypothetical protein